MFRFLPKYKLKNVLLPFNKTSKNYFRFEHQMKKPLDLPKFFAKQAPSFRAKAEQISIIKLPQDFHQHLKENALKSKDRIVLSSLYLGTDEKSQELVTAVLTVLDHDKVDALYESCKINKEVKITVLLDCLRGLREKDKNSYKMLAPLLRDFGSRVELYLFHTPKLYGLLKKLLPNRVNEVIGVQHMKLYIFDNDTLISGANMSDTYFVNRQDRYYNISKHSELTNYFHNLVNTVCKLSFRIDSEGTLKWNNEDKYNPTVHPMKFKHLAHQYLHPYTLPNTDTTDSNNIDSSESDTWLFPTIQFGPAHICHDEGVLTDLLIEFDINSKLSITSPYMNFTSKYTDILLHKCLSNISIITASPQANGFFTAKDYSNFIPFAYAALEHQFYKLVDKYRLHKRLHLFEYFRDKWTFHGKGLWYTAPGDVNPSMCLVGSANLGVRSKKRDLEAQLFLVTTNKNLQVKLQEERDYFFEHSTRVSDETWLNADHKLPYWMRKPITTLIKDFM